MHRREFLRTLAFPAIVVSLDELVCPVLCRISLLRSGEAGCKPDDETEPPAVAETGTERTVVDEGRNLVGSRTGAAAP